ncbi:zinc-dependent MarR family transcriptional regulator [Lactococcus sp.]|uniref:zinc-dependent MarR family transcriptional regulator n=1 Tax=Lactococcus sp. TaxID=44273 RepID=UPI0035B3CAB6
MSLELQIDQFLSQVTQFAENKHEILLGKCESGVQLTSTQEHILMLLKTETLTNAKIAELLSISPAAVTKAIKKLQEQGLTISSRLQADERVVLWSLTPKALPIAQEHAQHHASTLEAYKKLTEKFTSEDQEVIHRFLSELTEVLE